MNGSRMAEAAGAWRRRGDMVLRVIAAVPLGYAAASLWGMAFARLLPAAASEASIIGQLAAFAICAGFAMWAFAARSGWRATWTIALAGALAGLAAWASILSGGRL